MARVLNKRIKDGCIEFVEETENGYSAYFLPSDIKIRAMGMDDDGNYMQDPRNTDLSVAPLRVPKQTR